MVQAQGFTIADDGSLLPPEDLPTCAAPKRIPPRLIPRCPVCGKPMTMNLRIDGTFVEDAGWHQAAERYHAFLDRVAGGRVIFLELGVGGNTPGIIKYPFWQMTAANKRAVYVCINRGEATCPRDIAERSVLIDADIAAVLRHASQETPAA